MEKKLNQKKKKNREKNKNKYIFKKYSSKQFESTT